jgi:hypothetical protein
MSVRGLAGPDATIGGVTFMADDCGFVAFHTRSPSSPPPAPTLAGTSPGSSPITVGVDPAELVRLRAIAEVAEGLTTALGEIADRPDAEMEHAKTLHYDMRDIALKSLAAYRKAKGEG